MFNNRQVGYEGNSGKDSHRIRNERSLIVSTHRTTLHDTKPPFIHVNTEIMSYEIRICVRNYNFKKQA